MGVLRSPSVRWIYPLAILLCAAPARASMNETLDLALYGAHVGTEERVATGLAYRTAFSFGPVRFGNGIGGVRRDDGAGWLSAEVFAAFAPNGYWRLRPSLELRVHGDRVQLGDDVRLFAGAGPRLGVLFPIDEYFFVDAGVSRDLFGPETFRGTIGIGLPIPLSHL